MGWAKTPPRPRSYRVKFQLLVLKIWLDGFLKFLEGFLKDWKDLNR